MSFKDYVKKELKYVINNYNFSIVEIDVLIYNASNIYFI